jgi:uncharacterized protein YecT (DUF1311 family)
MNFVATLAAVALAISVPALAKASPPPPSARGCEQAAHTQGELTACAAGQAAAADRRLNAAYRDVLRYVDGEEKAKLIAAERAWVGFRDADCAFFGSGGGSIAPMNEAFCRADLSLARAKELEGWPPNAPRSALVPRR